MASTLFVLLLLLFCLIIAGLFLWAMWSAQSPAGADEPTLNTRTSKD